MYCIIHFGVNRQKPEIFTNYYSLVIFIHSLDY